MRHRAVFYLVFFLSGLASLADEIVWFKALNRTFGVTTIATATLLAVFMAGLGLGSWGMGRIASRLRRPGIVYGALEAGIGAFALATPAVFAGIDSVYVALYRSTGAGPASLFGIRFLLSAAALLAPTILMGATFPVLSRQMESGGVAGSSTGKLYAVNTAGAVCGVLLCGFWSLPGIGFRATLAVSACVSLCAALIGALVPSEIGRAGAENEGPERPRPDALWIAVAALTGFAAMADEVLWTRILVLHLGSSVYSFSLMLAVTLAGIASGSLWAARGASGDPRRGLFRAQLALGVVLVVQVVAFRLYSSTLVFVGIHFVHARTFLDLLATRALVTGLYLLPPTFLSGAAFSFLLKASSERPDSTPRRASRIYAANTAGAILGSAAAGFALIPLIGSQWSLFASGLVGIAIAALLQPRAIAPRLAAAACVAVAVLSPRDAVLLSTGVFSDVQRSSLVFYKEDVTATVAVKRYARPREWMSLELNGVNVAGTSPELVAIQKLQAHLPLSLAAHPREIVHIGFGSGGTAYSASLHPVSRIRIVEISPEVVSASGRFFRQVNHGILDDPRVKVTINDGRNFVLATPERFDAILSDSIHPRYAGNGSLYTEEYFRLCARRLRPGGVISMWLPMYSLRPQDYRSIVRAFRDVFPNVSIWYVNRILNSFTIVLATPSPTVPLRQTVSALSDPAIRADLAEIGEDDPAVLLSNLLLAPDAVSRWVEGASPHTDDLPTVEFESGKVLGYGATWYLTLSDLAAHRSRIEDFVAGLAPGDPLSARIEREFDRAGGVLRAQLDVLRRGAATEP